MAKIKLNESITLNNTNLTSLECHIKFIKQTVQDTKIAVIPEIGYNTHFIELVKSNANKQRKQSIN